MNAEAAPLAGRMFFVAGASGHTGSRLVRRLLERGASVRALTHSPRRAHLIPTHERLELVQGDLKDPGALAGAMRGADAAFNIAHMRYSAAFIAACDKACVRRAVAMSSTRRFTRFPERTSSEVIEGEAIWEASGLDFTILRATMIFGSERDNNLERIANALRRRRLFPLIAGGRGLLQPIFVWDLVDAMECAIINPEPSRRKVLTVAGPEPISQREIIETIGRVLGRSPIFVPVPYSLMMAGAWLAEKLLPKPPLRRDQIRRLLEDKDAGIAEAKACLPGWSPRAFEEAVRMKIEGKA